MICVFQLAVHICNVTFINSFSKQQYTSVPVHPADHPALLIVLTSLLVILLVLYCLQFYYTFIYLPKRRARKERNKTKYRAYLYDFPNEEEEAESDNFDMVIANKLDTCRA